MVKAGRDSIEAWLHIIDSIQCYHAKYELTILSVAVLRGDSGISGVVTFEQSEEEHPTTITYEISGNTPNAERGFHVHTFGDNTNGCTSAGPHFNPFGKTHGAKSDENRHVGDLGNISTDENGLAKGTITDNLVKLIGPNSILGVSKLLCIK